MMMVVGRGRLITPNIGGLRGNVIILAWRGPCRSTNAVIPKSGWVLIIRWRLSHVRHIWGYTPNITSLRHTLAIIIIIIITRRHNIIHSIRHTLGELLIISVLDYYSLSSAAPPIASASTTASTTTGPVDLLFAVAREIGIGIRLSHMIFFMDTNNNLVLHLSG